MSARRPRLMVRPSAASPEGRRSWSFGIRAGYWPCLRGLFLTISFAIWHVDLWWGLPSKRA